MAKKIDSKKEISRLRSEVRNLHKLVAKPLDQKSTNPFTGVVSGNYWTQTGMPWVSSDGRKAVLTEWFWQPIRGQPRRVDTNELRQFSQTFWVFSCVKTILDEITSVDWDIIPKENFEFTEVEEAINEVKEFLKYPNKNRESFMDVMRALVKDILEIDAGVLVKVFDVSSYDFDELEPKSGAPMLKEQGQRKLLELYARDGSSFLQEVDKFGFCKGHWQYSYQIPAHPMWFNRDEIVYVKQHGRSMSPYGYSVPQAIMDIIKSLHYSLLYNKRFFEETPIPDGALGLLDTNETEMKSFMEFWNKEFKAQPHKLAVINKDIKWQPFNVTNRELEFLETQSWYYKMVITSFGLTPSELGITEDLNRATSSTQAEVSKRKAIRPLLKILENCINEQIIPEFGYDGIEFTFVVDDPVEKTQKLNNWEKELSLGLKTINDVRDEMGLEPVAWGETPSNMRQVMPGQGQPGQEQGGMPNAEETSIEEEGQEDTEEAHTEASKDDQRRQEAKNEADSHVKDIYSSANRPVGNFKSIHKGFEVTRILIDQIANTFGFTGSVEELTMGLYEEQEHADVTMNDPMVVAEIALAHLREDPQYYSKLKGLFKKKHSSIYKGVLDGQYYFEPQEVVLISDHRDPANKPDRYASSEQTTEDQWAAMINMLICSSCGHNTLAVDSQPDDLVPGERRLKCTNCAATFTEQELLDQNVLDSFKRTLEANPELYPTAMSDIPEWSPKSIHKQQFSFPQEELKLTMKQFCGFDYSKRAKTILEYVTEGPYKKYLLEMQQEGWFEDLTERQLDNMIKVLAEAIKKNLTISDVSRKLRPIIKDKFRAEAIARTETIRLINEGERLDLLAHGIEKVKWVAGPEDGRTCEKCLKRDGRLYDISYAKDLIPAHPNCRCRFV